MARCLLPRRVRAVGHDLRQANDEMLVATVCGDQQRVPSFVTRPVLLVTPFPVRQRSVSMA